MENSMSISRQQFEKFVVNPTVSSLMLPRPADAAHQLMTIVANESRGGYWLHKAKGTGIGPWGMEPTTFTRILQRLRAGGKGSQVAVERLKDRTADQMTHDFALACEMARWNLWFDPLELPAISDRKGQYDCYIRVWRPIRKPTERAYCLAYDHWGIADGDIEKRDFEALAKEEIEKKANGAAKVA